MNIEVNYYAIAVAGIASMGLGFLWYGTLFGKVWMKLKGYSHEDLKKEQKKMGVYYGLSFIVSTVTAYVLTHVIAMSQNFYGNPGVQTGLMSAFFSWLGFMMPVQMTATIFGDKNWKLLSIDTGYQLTSVLLMGVILGYMG